MSGTRFLPEPLISKAAMAICLVIAAIILLIGLILFILSFILEPAPPVTETPQSGQSATDVARDGGPSAIPPGAGAAPSPPGLPPSSAVGTNLRIISRYMFALTPAPTSSYPPAPGLLEMPSWWMFPGRWGVRVMNRVSGQWDSGTRRTDAFERSRGYWNTWQLVAFLGDLTRAFDGITA